MVDEFELKLGISGGAGSNGNHRYLGRILKESGGIFPRPLQRRAYVGTRSGRGSVAARMLRLTDRYSGLRSRRAIVNTRIVRLSRNCFSPMRAYLSYLERGAVRAENEPGRLYSPNEDETDSKPFVSRSKGDRHQFRMVLSPEDGVNYEELRPLVRCFMGRMEDDLGTALDWVAADH